MEPGRDVLRRNTVSDLSVVASFSSKSSLTFRLNRFGHQDRITGIDAGIRERAITSGGRDGTVRVWKIVEESQLVFNAPSIASGNASTGAGSTATGSVDAVKLIDEEHFVTCGEDG